MKIKKEYIILTVIIVVLLLYLSQRSTDRTLYQLPEMPEISNSDISRLEVKNNATSIVISKEGNQWIIGPEKYPADRSKINSMLDVIGKLSLTALVSQSKSYARYHLDESNQIKVKAFDKDKLRREFDIGKAAASFRHTFVKIAGDERVYHARGSFRGKFDTTVEDLRDKAVFSFKIDEIREINISQGKKRMAFNLVQSPKEAKEAKKEDGDSPKVKPVKMIWQTADGKTANHSKINRLLTTLADLSCKKYIANRTKDQFTDPIFTLLLKGSQEYKLSIFEKPSKENEDYPGISSENNYPFILSASEAKSIMEDPDELLEKKKE
jgi:hypothetical protein